MSVFISGIIWLYLYSEGGGGHTSSIFISHSLLEVEVVCDYLILKGGPESTFVPSQTGFARHDPTFSIHKKDLTVKSPAVKAAVLKTYILWKI